MDDSIRLGPVTRLFDLPAPEQSLRVQDGGQQCGNKIDGRGARPRPVSAARGLTVSATAQELTWRNGIGTLIKDKCEECHGVARPEYQEWNLGDKKKGSRIVSYADFMSYVIWPATGAAMRRLDDGKSNAEGKPGNMYEYLGETDAERAENLAKIKNWLGEGVWNLNRWGVRGSVPAVAKEQLDKVKAKY